LCSIQCSGACFLAERTQPDGCLLQLGALRVVLNSCNSFSIMLVSTPTDAASLISTR
jgi:hypothetical protein